MSFTAKQVIALTGINPNTLHSWAKTGFVVPSVANTKGTGNKRQWSFQDIVAIKTAMMLRQSGVSQQALKKVVSYIQTYHGIEHPLASARLVVSGNDVLYCYDESTLVSALRRPGQVTMQFVIALGELVQELQKEVQRLEQAA